MGANSRPSLIGIYFSNLIKKNFKEIRELHQTGRETVNYNNDFRRAQIDQKYDQFKQKVHTNNHIFNYTASLTTLYF